MKIPTFDTKILLTIAFSCMGMLVLLGIFYLLGSNDTPLKVTEIGGVQNQYTDVTDGEHQEVDAEKIDAYQKSGKRQPYELAWDDVELAENADMGMKDLVVRTVPQKPDIVLQLTKNDLQQGMKMTYLFDAKYRIADRQNGVDTPPDDAINQMHRYRDAIYYKEHGSEALKKEVIGGYILFPGDGEPDDVAMARFHKSIEEVNIGAFPLRPKDRRNRRLLEDFIEQLIGKDTEKILDDSIPQKGLFYTSEEPKDAVYMILTLDEQVNEDVTSILEGKASHIIMGKKGLEEAKDIQSIRYIAPIKPGSHIEGYYRVSQARLKRIDDAAYPVRIIFDVKDWVKLKTPAKYGLVKYAYRGHCKTRAEFFKHCENNPAIDKL